MTGEFDSIYIENGRGLIEIFLLFKRLPSEPAKQHETHQGVWSKFWRQFESNLLNISQQIHHLRHRAGGSDNTNILSV
jgi:hypothetical protein